DSLLIKGPTQLNGALLSSHNDHRIAMSCIVAGIVADGVTRISGVECIKKSYPSFIEDMKNIGADIIDV
ncbi:MAG: 3-phosphoshikimate 1-carboxyvinyltransferase, partial [Candidatus Methanofastidiosia archaeon]